MKKKRSMSCMMTHIPLLTKAFDESEGPVLELGTGYFSTLFLDWLCSTFGRKLVSYDDNERWGKRAMRYKSNYHKIYIAKDWDKIKIDKKHWGLVFIDHSPKGRRHIDAIRLAGNADFIVMHDTEPAAEKLYHYSKVWEHFKYRFDYTKVEQWTSVVSNTKELNW